MTAIYCQQLILLKIAEKKPKTDERYFSQPFASHTRNTEVSKVSVLCGGDGDGGDGTLDMDVEGFYFTYLIVL